MNAVFYVVRFADARVCDILNIMRFAANTEAKRTAHITVRGPYKRRLPENTIRRLSQWIDGAEVQIDGAGTFFNKQQNTVYLHCHSPAIKQVWQKPQHSYTPHLTIYDGGERNKAQQIHQQLANAKVRLICRAGALEEMLSPINESQLRPAINNKTLSQIIGKQTSAEEITTMPWPARLRLIKTLADRLTQ